ncbi:hypothetical protein Cni_G05941 [Canna indica]|uniref:Aprataxin C2HE/C2H2/C2HC zinc finger domain-containing protein n=1 Tax=Canna indica TaxID=4628 RepID=A0AAQ3JVW3_9LILI|nr:hypothetical protein Cni_G05941 [Canna indica]
MGASESLLSKQQLQQQPIDEITTVSERIEGIDSLLEHVRALKISFLLTLWRPEFKLLLATLGEKGCKYYTKCTTGAGDAFVGAFLWKLVDDQSVLQLFQKWIPAEAVDLVSRLLKYSPNLRFTAMEACAHPFFDELRDPNTCLLDGNPLPPLFNFTPLLSFSISLSCSPQLIQRFLPEHTKHTLGIEDDEEEREYSRLRSKLEVPIQDFDSTHLKCKKKHWNSFNTSFLCDSTDVLKEIEKHGVLTVNDDDKLLTKELRCHKCCSVHPNIPRLKSHITNCKAPLPNSPS